MKTKNLWIRALSFAVCLCMVMGMVPFYAAAEADVASVSMNGTVTGTYATFEEAVQAVDGATEADNAKLTLLMDVDLGSNGIAFQGCDFTLDLNGHKITGGDSDVTALRLLGGHQTITDSVGGGSIEGGCRGIVVFGSTLTLDAGSVLAYEPVVLEKGEITINGGSLTSQPDEDGDLGSALLCAGGNATVTGGTFYGVNGIYSPSGSVIHISGDDTSVTGTNFAVTAGSQCDLTITGGTFNSGYICLYANSSSKVTVTGGTFQSESSCIFSYTPDFSITGGTFSTWTYMLYLNSGAVVNITGGTFTNDPTAGDFFMQGTSKVILGVGDDGIGAAFPGGLHIPFYPLADALADGAAFWQGSDMIGLRNNQYDTGNDDVVVKTACTHENGTQSEISQDTSKTHCYTWSCCNCTVYEEHGKDSCVVHAPTCTGNGYTTYTCNACGYDYSADEVPALGHSKGELVNSVAPGCAVDGFTSYNCAVCGEVFDTDIVKATGHNIGDDGICIVCNRDSANQILISMTDEYGDSWNGNAIQVYEDDILVGTATVAEGSEAQWSFIMDPEKYYSFRWKNGSYAWECGFTISIMGETVFIAEYGDCNDFVDGEEFYPNCAHNYVAGTVVPPTCDSQGYTTYTCTLCGYSHDDDFTDPIHNYVAGTVVPSTCSEPGYTTYTCTLCGDSYAGDIEATLPHSFDEDGKCTVCGAEVRAVLTVNMTDSFGDGWNGNSILVYENGQQIATLTLESGSTGTWSYNMVRGNNYEMRWSQGSYASECSFEILLGDEVVCTATRDDCYGFAEDELVYSTCEHIEEILEVVEVTCTQDGYTLVRCTLCQAEYQKDKIKAQGHTEGDDLTVVPPTCTAEGYTSYTCTVCQDIVVKDYEDILPHTLGEGQVVTPTCTEYGYTSYTCTVCETVVEKNFVPVLPHIPGENGNCTVCGEEYCLEIWVATVEVTPDNMADILGDGTASFDPATNTLTLTDFYYEGDDVAVYFRCPLNVVLKGENYINSGDSSAFYTEIPVGSLSISGDGTLRVDNSQRLVDTDCDKSFALTIGGSVTIEAYIIEYDAIAVYADEISVAVEDNAKMILGSMEAFISGSSFYLLGEDYAHMTISDNASVSVFSEYGSGIFVYGDQASLTISDNASVSVVGIYDSGIYVEGEQVLLTICDNASVNACSYEEEGIELFGTGGEVIPVNADAVHAALLTISDNATVYAAGFDEALEAEHIAISGGNVTAISADDDAIYCEELSITGGTIYAKSCFDGLRADKIQISGGYITLWGDINSIAAWESVTITGGTVKALYGSIVAMKVDEEGNPLEGDAIILGENVRIESPLGAVIGQKTVDGMPYTTIVDADGEELYTFTISCAHEWAEGTCSKCGTVFTVTAKSFSLSFEEQIGLNMYYTVSDSNFAEEVGMLVFYSDPEAPDYAAADEVYDNYLYNEYDDRYLTSTDIAAKEMGDIRYYCAYAKMADGTYVYSKVHEYSPATYAYNKINNEETKDELKSLCVALLNYGTQAQLYFNYRTDALMNAALTEEQQNQSASFDWNDLNYAYPSSRETTFLKTEGFTRRKASVSFDGALAINYYFTPSTADANITLYYWTEQGAAWLDSLTAENATGSMEMIPTGDGPYWAQVGGIAPIEIDDTLYVAAVYTDDAGNQCCTGIISYSVSTYCYNQKDGTMGDLALATAAYGYYVKNYFIR